MREDGNKSGNSHSGNTQWRSGFGFVQHLVQQRRGSDFCNSSADVPAERRKRGKGRLWRIRAVGLKTDGRDALAGRCLYFDTHCVRASPEDCVRCLFE